MYPITLRAAAHLTQEESKGRDEGNKYLSLEDRLVNSGFFRPFGWLFYASFA